MDDVLAETRRLISADKVSGTTVYNKSGDAIGEVYDVMIDKATGKVAMPCCRSAASWGWAKNIIRCPGRCSNTSPRRAAMSSISRKNSSKARPPMMPAPIPIGRTAITRKRFTAITARRPIGSASCRSRE
jgi:hypothetical protein